MKVEQNLEQADIQKDNSYARCPQWTFQARGIKMWLPNGHWSMDRMVLHVTSYHLHRPCLACPSSCPACSCRRWCRTPLGRLQDTGRPWSPHGSHTSLYNPPPYPPCSDTTERGDNYDNVTDRVGWRKKRNLHVKYASIGWSNMYPKTFIIGVT